METIRQRTVKTRKPHRCHGCTEEYPSGSTMKVVVSKDMGEIFSTHYCNTCDSVLSRWCSEDLQNGIGYGDVRDSPEWDEVKNELT